MSDALACLLDTMLPGGDGFPSASDANVGAWLATQQRFFPSVERLINKLPEDFEGADASKRTQLLASLEQEEPALFDVVTVAIYSGYYTRPAVLAVIENACGYKATPPQPGGYEMPAFDPALLSIPASRAPQWRDPEEELQS